VLAGIHKGIYHSTKEQRKQLHRHTMSTGTNAAYHHQQHVQLRRETELRRIYSSHINAHTSDFIISIHVHSLYHVKSSTKSMT